MMAVRPSLSQDRAGVGTTEFALTFPIFLTLSIGAIELGAAFMSSAGLSHGVNEAARYATIFPTPTEEQLRQRTVSAGFGLSENKMTISVTKGKDVDRGDFIVINASYDHDSMTSLFVRQHIRFSEQRKVWIQPVM